MPFFSIIIPCYNQAIYLTDCLDSLLLQSYSDWEAIVINDGSTDNTGETAKKYTEKDSRIKLIDQSNQGLSAARNTGIKNAIGERLIFLDADDFFYDNALEVISRTAQLSDEYTLIQYGYAYISENKQTILRKILPSQKKQMIPDVFYAVPGPCNTLAISKNLALQCGPFDITLKSLEDWDYWIRTAKCGAKIKTIQESLVYYRYVKNSMSRNAFVMYESYKTVASRAPHYDNRLPIDAQGNKQYNINLQPSLNGALIRMLGVSIMQGKIDESIAFFKQESSKPIYAYSPIQFEEMCSYLSFRYWYSKADIDYVLNELYPLFKQFFKSMGCKSGFISEAMYHIFKRHLYYRNINKYGRWIGSLVNYILRKKYAK